ncbi:peptidoglycan-binding protein LysM [Polaribacter aestuariivivens]|uniref:Peptidoglycan-binding protein LysM n=1 Tax=Polaribacter aestuariivivens TaxID=2304626 RepID=A0A5S3N068_9FLAO|nr:peptidoglycan-binding protein LysM [Polaribacter aestuariivivens]TMM28621.1 peptidoglycan-binding protein LysM [Polaribacter aestuariivivens]
MHPQNRKIYFIKNKILLFSVVLLFINATPIDKNVSKSETTGITLLKFPKTIGNEIFYLKRDFVAFKEAVAFKESQGKYATVNTLGYLGKYQFGRTTLHRFNIYNTEEFLANPELQEKAFVALCKVNKWILRKDIKRSVGKTMNGIKITESGILAAAHLSGAGNVKKFLRSNGTERFSDAYGASIQSYLKKFANYNVSNIEADKHAKV